MQCLACGAVALLLGLQTRPDGLQQRRYHCPGNHAEQVFETVEVPAVALSVMGSKRVLDQVEVAKRGIKRRAAAVRRVEQAKLLAGTTTLTEMARIMQCSRTRAKQILDDHGLQARAGQG